jgi:hypothetical protein
MAVKEIVGKGLPEGSLKNNFPFPHFFYTSSMGDPSTERPSNRIQIFS